MMRKMFNCPNCGTIEEIKREEYLSYDYENHIVKNIYSWICPECECEVDINNVVEIEVEESK